MKLKKFTAALSAFAISAGMASALPMSGTAAGDYNYAEALQKSMFFYEVQQAGVLPEWNSVSWRADSMVDEDGNETDVVAGGWFDAGDHFKFTLTNAYSASIMAWGYIQYKDALEKAGLAETYKNNVKWAMDFVKNCDRGDKVIGTIGDFTGGSTDHNIWCSAEVYLRKHHLNNDDWERPYDEIENASVEALAAACLAEGYIMFKDEDPDTAEEYLKHAKSLFELADKTRDCKDVGGMAGMYGTASWLDDCMYAANWLYMATGDQSYLDKIESDYIPNFPKEEQSSENKFTWGLCWDDTSQAAALLYAMNTGKKEWVDHVSHHLDYWMDGYGGKKIDYTPDGLAWLFQWGSLRHATTTAWLAFLSSDTVFKDDSALASKYKNWAKSQMDYAFGDNDLNQSYVLGMGDVNPTAIHHRTASGIHDDHWNDLGQPASNEGWQTEYAHTLYGALVGGPDREGKYVNEVAQYQYSEVAIDYNAGFTAALCAMVDEYGGTKLADFPPTETPTWDEWEVAAVLNGSGDSYSEIKAWAMNHTAWPARVEKNISYRYYFDVSEVLAAGLSIDNITVKSGSQQYQEGQQGYAEVGGPYKYDGDPTGNTYYAEIKFLDGRAIQPTGQSEHRDEVQFRISIPDAIDGKSTKGAWDPSNDWSYEGVEDATDLKKPDSLNKHITMYVNDVLVWGTEPDGTEATPGADIGNKPNPTNPPATDKPDSSNPSDTLYGDVNCDKEITVADATLLLQY
ncbi:MAG: glycoside hydrolase family 9 protein, partial [Ruminococcus sp.]|nr:glycoside hydrolase family 9 protein [Ruminococcus sp.]